MVFLHQITKMVIFPKAKINIGLRITGKRPDGYHNLETIFYPVCLFDAIEFVVPEEKINDDVLVVTGLLSGQDNTSNLVMKAVRKIRETDKIPFLKIHLHKAIPVGAGLGGGSSDASAMLKSLNRYFNLEIANERLKEISSELGSDCPFFIEGSPSFAEGRGELLAPVGALAEGLHLILVNPGIHVNTKEAYSYCTPNQPDSDLRELYNLHISEWKGLIVNDFELPVFRKYPQIAILKEQLYNMGAVFSSMSGSGSTVYGIFKNKPEIPESIRGFVIYSGLL
jgi:4-diphosphocytidyl-2-C-methyl-D-erythritol kinase